MTVRARLSAGEQRAQFARMYTIGATGRYIANPLMTGVGVVLAYLLDWTLRDDQDRPVAIRDLSPDDLLHVIDALDVESFDEIKTAIEQHESAMNAERTQEKKLPDGGTAS